MIHNGDILNLHFYDYDKSFTGSQGNMRYRIIKAKRILENEKTEPYFEVTVWCGPYAYDTTKEEKTKKEFEFSNEGKKEVVAWLNQQYIEYEKRVIQL